MFQADVIQQATKGFATGTKIHSVITSFAATMLESLIERYSIYPAKGTSIAKFAHNADQMMVTHILNGLFPTLTLVYEAQLRGLPRLANLQIDELKIYMLAYTMHDLDKILGDQLKTLTKKGTSESRQKLLAELTRLNAHAFFPDVEHWAHEILWLAVNTQRSRDINLSHNTFVSSEALVSANEAIEILHTQPHNFRTRVESTLRDLCTFSDLIAFFVKSPEDALLSDEAARRGGIADLMQQLTDGQFSLAYHKLTEVRGFLSNQINNAAMRYLRNIYPAEQEELIPYLYFPNGVVYLNPQHRAAPTIAYKAVHTSVEEEIQEACSDIANEGAGFGFNHLGLLKYPRYLHDFLSVEKFLALFVDKTLKESKVNIAENTLQSMRKMQANGVIPGDMALDYTPNERIAQLGRFLINYMHLIDDNLGKKSAHIKRNLEKRLATRLGEDAWDEARQIPSSGGVGYRFYWIAAQYLRTHPLATFRSSGDSLEGLFSELIDELLQLAGDELRASENFQGPYLHDLADYLDKNLSFGFGSTSHIEALPDFTTELAGYSNAKRPRLNQLTCTICNSAYPTQQQEDASVLFQPWVYKNRLPLYKGENAGGICSICSLELMLRQILLRDKPGGQGRINVTGKSYEDLELKYFFLYPGFFFTNQTFRLSNYIVRRMQNLKLYEVCEVLRAKERVSAADILNLTFFNLTQRDRSTEKKKEKDKKGEQEEKGGMYLFEHYEEKQYPGFIFFAKKTFSKKQQSGETTKATTASWVEAAWLGLALPLVTGTRVVVTESYLPLFNSCADFPETIVLDAPHQSVRHLLTSASARLRLDQLLGSSESKRSEGDWIGGTLAAFSRAIELHIDTERVGGDLKLERFTRIGRDLETDQLVIFSFLREQMRQAKMEVMPADKANHYSHIYYQFVNYYHPNEGDAMNKIATRHERAVELYSKFYSPFTPGKSFPKSHAIVRPVDIAAQCIIKDTLNLTKDEIKLEMVGKLLAWLEIVSHEGATGKAFVHRSNTINEKEERLVSEFVDYVYDEIFVGYAEEQRSLLNRRLNRFKNACEAAFRRRYYKDKGPSVDAVSDQTADDNETEVATEMVS